MIIKQKQPGNAKDNPTKLATLSSEIANELQSMDALLEALQHYMHELNEKIDAQVKAKQKEDDATDDEVKLFKKLKDLQDKNNEIMKEYQVKYQEVKDAFTDFDHYYKNHYLSTIQKYSST